VAMTMDARPPRTDRVDNRSAGFVHQPGPVSTTDRYHRSDVEVVEVGRGMPKALEIACCELVRHGLGTPNCASAGDAQLLPQALNQRKLGIGISPTLRRMQATLVGRLRIP